MKTDKLLIAVIGVFAGVILTTLAYQVKLRKLFTSDGSLKQEIVVNPDSWQKLNLILELVERNYVDTIDREAVTRGALDGALYALDPHSMYFPPEDLKESESEIQGNFDGIGIQFNVPSDTAIVLEVISGGPSEKIGLRSGDRILKVDDKTIAGVRMPQDSMVRLMKGPSGSKVVITVERDGETIPFNITRGKIPVHAVDAAFMMADTVGYIKINTFSLNTYHEFRTAVDELKAEGMKRLIIDVRGNVGGLLDQALRIADEFLPKDAMIVYTEGLHSPRQDNKASGRGSLRDLPLSVLIDDGSASASEILAGAIQDNDRGVIVGRRSFGKGLVQEPFFFTDGSGIRITIARFYTPSGRCIQKPYDVYDEGDDLYYRYMEGELFSADKIKTDSTDVHYTVGGRTVYGGGGIIPDVFVPMDTTKVTPFHLACNRKATTTRFAAWFFEHNKGRIAGIKTYEELDRYLSGAGLDKAFLSYAASTDDIRPADGEWAECSYYLIPQLYALVGRYSTLGQNAFYKYYADIDPVIIQAMEHSSEVKL